MPGDHTFPGKPKEKMAKRENAVVVYISSVKKSAFALLLAIPLLAEVKMTRQQDRIAVSIDGKPFTTFYFGPETMKPYLHPLRTASGTIVTRGYPMENIEGETRDHPHHQGVWFTHGDVNGYDFWSNPEKGPKKGRVVLDRIVRVQGGSKTGIIWADFNWVGADGKPLLKEQRKMTFYDEPEIRMVDFDITLTAVERVKFGDTKEGTFAIRLADSMTEKAKGGVMTSAEEQQTMKNVWGKPSPWVDYSGKVGGETVGVAIFDHPSNPKHPTHWHSRDYGLFAANIFGEHDFYSDKSRDGSVSLEAGKSLRFRYRVVVHPGDTEAADVASLYERYKQANEGTSNR
jgi:hypothetical protein